MELHTVSTVPLFLEYAPLQRVAVCRPSFFTLREPINVIQQRELAAGRVVSLQRAEREHDELRSALRAAGAEIIEIEPDRRFPYQLNTRDAGLGTPRGLLLGKPRLPIRQGEEQRLREAAERAGVPLLGAIRHAAFEGGDFVALSPTSALVGLGARTAEAALAELQRLLGDEVELIGVPFEARFLHLDMIFNVVAEGLALACAPALPPWALGLLRDRGVRWIDVSEEEVFHHGCNVLALGHERILSLADNQRINARLRAEGLAVLTLETRELVRSGGGPRCLTLPLDRG